MMQSLRLQFKLVVLMGATLSKNVVVYERFDTNQIIIRTLSYRALNAIERNRTILGLRESVVERIGGESYWVLDVEEEAATSFATPSLTKNRPLNNYQGV